MMFEWQDKYAIGLEEIDNQHKRLFELANKIYDLLKNDSADDKYDKIVDLIEELRNYTVYHFNAEEEYMESIDYMRIFSQKIAHKNFIDKIMDIDLNQIDNNQDEYLLNTLNFIVDWLAEHIIKADHRITE